LFKVTISWKWFTLMNERYAGALAIVSIVARDATKARARQRRSARIDHLRFTGSDALDVAGPFDRPWTPNIRLGIALEQPGLARCNCPSA
jgi:hypothetical protein